HDLSEGGLAVALAEMVISSDFGASVDLSEVPTQTKLSNTSLLFSESNGRFLVEVAKEREKEFESLVKGDFAKIGVVCKKRSLEIRRDGKTIICLSSEKLRSAWKKRLW
ncbi:MAG: AIR synthase-related protein, partial [Candidatus Hadarchaeales archaeon]